MRRYVTFLVLSSAIVLAAGVLRAQSGAPPAWAYGIDPTAAPPAQGGAGRGGGGGGGRGGAAQAAPDTTTRQIPGSPLSFTLAQVRDAFGPADWFPNDHPEMPPVVAHGRGPDVRACSLCHYPN